MESKKDINKIFSDYTIMLANKHFFIVLAVASSVLLTRTLGQGGFGQFSLFMMVANIIFITFISWSSNSVLRFGKEEFIREGKLNKVFWARNIIIFWVLLISFTTIFILRANICAYLQIKFAYIYVLLYILIFCSLDYISYIFQAVRKLRLYSFIEVLNKFLFLVFLLVFLVLGKSKVPYILCALVVSQLLTFIIFIRYINFDWLFPIVFDKKSLKEIFTFSYPLILSSISAYIINYIDIIVIKKYLLFSDVGIYSLSYNIMNYFHQVIMIVISVTGPILISLLTENKKEIVKLYITRIVPQGIFFWSMFLTLSILAMPYIIPLIFGWGFKGSVTPSLILLLGLVYNGIACFYSGILSSYKLIKEIVIVNIAMALINLAGDFLLVPIIGINGAAISSAVIYSLGACGYMLVGNRILGLKEYKALIFLIPAALILLASIFKFNIVASSLIAAFLYYLFLTRLKIFRVSDLEFLGHIDMPLFVRNALIKTYKFLDKS